MLSQNNTCISVVHVVLMILSSESLNLITFLRIRLFQQHIRAAIFPPAAFVAVPRLPPPPFESRLLLPVHYSDSDDENEDHSSLCDYQQQTITSSSMLLRGSNNDQFTQTM